MHPLYSEYRPLLPTQDERTIVKYVMEVFRLFLYPTLWMSKRHAETLHNVITVFNDMINDADGIMRASAKKMTKWNED